MEKTPAAPTNEILKECIRLKMEGRFEEAEALATKMRGHELVLTKEQLAAMREITPDGPVEVLDVNLPGFGFMAEDRAATLALLDRAKTKG